MKKKNKNKTKAKRNPKKERKWNLSKLILIFFFPVPTFFFSSRSGKRNYYACANIRNLKSTDQFIRI